MYIDVILEEMLTFFCIKIPGRVIRKSLKKKKNMVLDATLLNTQHYKVLIKGKVEQSREWSSDPLYPTALCSSYWKGSLWVTLD